jgi:hypothetical protein
MEHVGRHASRSDRLSWLPRHTVRPSRQTGGRCRLLSFLILIVEDEPRGKAPMMSFRARLIRSISGRSREVARDSVQQSA